MNTENYEYLKNHPEGDIDMLKLKTGNRFYNMIYWTGVIKTGWTGENYWLSDRGKEIVNFLGKPTIQSPVKRKIWKRLSINAYLMVKDLLQKLTVLEPPKSLYM